MPKKISVVEINENTSYDDVVNRVVEEEKVEEPIQTPEEPTELIEAPGLEPPAKRNALPVKRLRWLKALYRQRSLLG